MLLICRVASNLSERPGGKSKIKRSYEDDRNSDNWEIFYSYYDSISGSDLDSIEDFVRIIGSFEAPP
jgi:hypothetical protein